MRRRSSSDSYSDIERKKEKRRMAWMIAQAKEREHERLKRKKIEEYERRRAEQLKLNSKQTSLRRSRSKSEESYDRNSKINKSQIMSEKLNLSSGSKSFFKGPDEPQRIDISELQQVKVKIHRKIPAPTSEANEIRRVLVNPEEITLKRREGEGTKPIFDRKELINCHKSMEVEEHRTVEAVGIVNKAKRSESKRRSVSLSPRRRRSPSPYARSSVRTSSRQSRHHSDRRESREDSRRRRTSESRSYSRERDYYKSKRDYERSEKDHREYSSRYKDHSHDRRERRDRDSSRERNPPPSLPPPPSQYLEQVPFPMYYGGFAPRPIVPPIRGPIMRGRIPAPIRPPFPPRYIGPQDMYRVVLPHDPRYGQMY